MKHERKKRKMDMTISMKNVISVYRAGSLRAVEEKMSKYMLDLLGVEEVRWDGGGTEPARELTFLYGNGNKNQESGMFFFVHKRIISTVTRVC
jgi:hypothetical protein